MTRERLVVIGAVPPPYHGVTISTSLVLASPTIRNRFVLEHLDTSDRRSLRNIGHWDIRNLALGMAGVARLARLLKGARGVVYLPISQSAAAFLRDSLFILIASRRGWKVAAHLRGSEFGAFYARQPRALQRWITTTLSRVDSMAVMGSRLRGVFAGLMPDDRIAVVPNGTPDLGEPPADRDSRTVLILSNLLPRKGIAEAVDAALLVLEQRPDARFIFAGAWRDETFERRMRARAHSAGDAIRFLPPRTGQAKNRLLHSAAILLFPPVEPEGHPRTVLEGIAAGMPVVATDRGAIADTIADGETGYVLEHPVPSTIADRVLRLLDDDGLRVRMGRAARQRYLSQFTQEAADIRLADWLAETAKARA